MRWGRIGVSAVALLALGGLGGQRVLVRHAAQSSPPPPRRCTPRALGGSALLPGTTLTASPMPGSFAASPRTQISLLGAAPSALADVGVEGSDSGRHGGHLRGYSQGDGASFLPDRPFAPGETVTVSGRELRGGASARFAFSFTVAEPDRLPYSAPGAKPTAHAGEVQSFHTQPAMRAPRVTIAADSPATEPGYVFAAPYSGPSQDGPLIFDDAGDLVWFHPLALGTEATNLQVQSYEGRPVLTWWQGYIPPQGFGEGEEIVDDSSYREIARIDAGNGYAADLHDFRIAPDDTALLTAFDPVHCDLRAVGGVADAAVSDSVFQEIDLRTRLVRREWHSLDHIPLADSFASPKSSSPAWPFDYFHVNSVERAGERFLISARNTSAVYELDASTGRVLLQVGGHHSAVAIGTGASMAYQHDAQQLPDGDFSIFDNGGVPMVHSQSRGIVVALDAEHRTATLIAQFEHPTPLQAGSQGNIEPLANGDFFLGWGAEPYFSEFTPGGTMIFDARLPHGTQSYRGYRFQWNATPAEAPVAARSDDGSRTTVYASWNGATGVAAWRVLAGAAPAGLAPAASAARGGFETAIALPDRPAYVAVQALDASGATLATSRAVGG
jgi:hypothetical protein